MHGIIDIGSNTMRLSCYHLIDGEIKYVFHKKRMIGLASYVNQEGRLSRNGVERAIGVLEDFKLIISSLNMKNLHVIATASFRNVTNTAEIVKKIKERTDFDVEVISGEQEAISDFVGATYGKEVEDGMLMDIGGGSTEMVFNNGKEIKKAMSLPVGSLNMYSRNVIGIIPTKDEMKKIKKFLEGMLEEVEFYEEAKVGIGVGGTNRALCKLYNDLFDMPVNNLKMEFIKLKEILRMFKNHPDEGMSRVLRIATDRVHTIVPGLLILITIMKHYKCEQITISKWGLREGYLLSSIENEKSVC